LPNQNSFCPKSSVEIVNTDETESSYGIYIYKSSSTTYYARFNSTATLQTYDFTLKFTFPNNIVKYSPNTYTIFTNCSSKTIYKDTSAPSSTVYIEGNDTSKGFLLGRYYHYTNTYGASDACPVNLWRAVNSYGTSCSSASSISGLKDGEGDSDSTILIKPIDTSLHRDYVFYLKVWAKGGSEYCDST
jgi:hypothetical protein